MGEWGIPQSHTPGIPFLAINTFVTLQQCELHWQCVSPSNMTLCTD